MISKERLLFMLLPVLLLLLLFSVNYHNNALYSCIGTGSTEKTNSVDVDWTAVMWICTICHLASNFLIHKVRSPWFKSFSGNMIGLYVLRFRVNMVIQ